MDLTVLAVQWDDISGPSIISLFPQSSLNDPESVALQIYLASVTVFGQHGHSQRTEFSVPLLSLGQGMSARVAFDSWNDSSLRGKDRPFFLAFLNDKTTSNKLNSHFDNQIFKYLDLLKEKRSDFSAQTIWERISKEFKTTDEKTGIDDLSFEFESDYSIPRATRDLIIAKDAWEKLKDRTQLWTAIRVANRLEHVDDKSAGEAFSLAGQIFFDSNNFREAKESFEKATDSFSRVRLFENAGEASSFAGKSAYHLEQYDLAIDLYQAGARWIKDPLRIASLNYDMGIVLHEQAQFEEANACFEKAVKLSTGLNRKFAADYSSTFASRLLSQAENERVRNPAYALALTRRSAEHREEAARLFRSSNENPNKAATSLILATNAYFSLGNNVKGINLLEEAVKLFNEGEDYISACKSLYDGARAIKDQKKSYNLLSRAISLFSKEKISIKEKRLLGLVSFEKGKIEEKQNLILTALGSYKYSVQCLTESDAPVSDLIPVQIQNANSLFKMEDFESAAQMFFAASKGLTELESTNFNQEQRKKAITNALISLRRASNVYHNAGVIALTKSEEKRSILMFTRSVSFLEEWIENNSINNQNEVIKVVENRISRLSLKIDLFTLAESKFELNKILRSLKNALQVYKKTNTII
ncbi:MAG: tetratricopeptide repeat protein [Candidatus Hodarchaeales archaeon]|jgi:tetratricopeptide (TPR) repeat protein